MTTKEAACAIKDWAIQNGAILKERKVYVLEPVPANAQAAVQQTLVPSEDVIRTRGLNYVTYDEGERKVIVFTAKKIPAKAKKTLPQNIEDITIEFKQGGLPFAGGSPPPPAPNPPYYLRAGKYCCGSSINVGNQIGAGTLGCLVKNADGKLFGLTNNHVTGGCNYSQHDLPILAPGPIDVDPLNIHPFTIGTHDSLLKMHPGHPDNVTVSDNTDAAIFAIKDPDQVSSFQGSFHDTPDKVGTMSLGMMVEKIGRTTGETVGRVQGVIAGAEPVSYGRHGEVYFDSFFVVEGVGGEFSNSGDSGSLVTACVGNDRVALGLVFAGNPETKITWVLPIGPILTKLGLSLVSGHNV